MSTQEKSFKAVDNTPATIYGATVDTDSNIIIRNDDNVSEVVVTSDEDVYFTFDEPVFVDTDVKFYLDSRNITQHVAQDFTVDPSGKTLKVDKKAGIKDLTLGEHVFEAVGVEDLAGNKPAGDIYEAIINVVEPKEDSSEPTKKPEVEKIKQIEEGKFEVTFKAAPVVGTLIVVKDSEGNTVVSHSTTGADTTEEVEFANNIADYNGSTHLIYTVEVTGADGGKIVSNADPDVKADKHKEVKTFKLDLEAPKASEEVEVDGAEIKVTFEDGPFDGPVAVGTPTKNIVLKLHTEDETKSVTIDVTDTNNPDLELTTALDDNVLTIDVAALKSNITELKDFLNDDDELVPGNYELILPRGLVKDTNDKKVTDSNIIPFAGKTLEFEVEEKGESDKGDASVPQTAQGLVEYDKDHDAIIVRFIGEDIKASTAKDPANYTLSGKAISVRSVEYEKLDDVENTGKKGAEVRLFLDKDTVKRDGNYTLKVENVSTTSGAKMLPVTVTVKDMKDNTRPVLESAVITGDAKLELRFSESVDIEDPELAAGNFEVTVNGATYNVAKAEVHETNDRLVILTLRDTIEYAGKTVIVITKADDNDDYFVRDLGGNELKAGVIVVATVKGE